MKLLNIVILLTTLTLISCGADKGDSKAPPTYVKSGVVGYKNLLWSSETSFGPTSLNVLFLGGHKKIKEVVKEAAREWTKYGNLNFYFFNSVNEIPYGEKAHIRISFKREGNYSIIGSEALNEEASIQTMNFDLEGRLYLNQRGTIMHEFGHALGLEHEHNSPKRPFEFDEAKMLESCKVDSGWTETMCRQNILDAVKENADLYVSKYDEKSIMHYNLHADMMKKNKKNYYKNKSLSLRDKLGIAMFYPGRMTPEQIMVSHEYTVKRVRETDVVGNCKIDPVKNWNGDLWYTYVSNVDLREFDHYDIYNGKEAVLHAMSKDRYCNLKYYEMDRYRADLPLIRNKKRFHNFCRIPALDERVNYDVNCKLGNYFHIATREGQKSVSEKCYPSFESAVSNMRRMRFCQLDYQKVAIYEKLKSVPQKETGRCFVASTQDRLAFNPKCEPDYPYLVSDRYGRKKMGSFCYKSKDAAVIDMLLIDACI